MAALSMALANARQPRAKGGETDALVNDFALSKRPSRARFQRTMFFKRLKQGKKKSSESKESEDEGPSAAKLRKTKTTPRGKFPIKGASA